ncbi:MAG: helix-turn-helix transcriptional regulator [Lysinibacillus sp.]
MDDGILAKRLKALREERGYFQKFVADKLGIKSNTLSGYENGTRMPDPMMLSKLADLYKVSSDYLIGLTDQKNPSDNYEIKTIAAHHDGDEWTEEELEDIARFKEFVKMKRGNKQQG